MSFKEAVRWINESNWTLVVIVIATTLYMLIFVNWQTALGYLVLVAILTPAALATRRKIESRQSAAPPPMTSQRE